jgi:hypothetical protein
MYEDKMKLKGTLIRMLAALLKLRALQSKLHVTIA